MTTAKTVGINKEGGRFCIIIKQDTGLIQLNIKMEFNRWKNHIQREGHTLKALIVTCVFKQ